MFLVIQKSMKTEKPTCLPEKVPQLYGTYLQQSTQTRKSFGKSQKENTLAEIDHFKHSPEDIWISAKKELHIIGSFITR